MVCFTCPLRMKCENLCPDMERELARLEAPQTEVILSPRAIEAAEIRNYEREMFTPAEEKSEETKTEAPIKKDLERALLLLRPQQRRVVHMIFWEGRSRRQTAQILGISKATVDEALSSAIRSLRNTLADEDGPMNSTIPCRFHLKGERVLLSA